MPVDAVGEKKRLPRAEEGVLTPPFPLGPRRSRLNVDPGPGLKYGPVDLPFFALGSPTREYLDDCAIAALLTDRCSDQATRPRQARTSSPTKPSAAPTHMNTVPSGREDFCMKGASAVGGTVGAG